MDRLAWTLDFWTWIVTIQNKISSKVYRSQTIFFFSLLFYYLKFNFIHLQESPFDGAAARHVKKAYSSIDKLSIRVGVALRYDQQLHCRMLLIAILYLQALSNGQTFCCLLHGKLRQIRNFLYFFCRLFFIFGSSLFFLAELQKP